jgi:hypothetical protein
MNSRLWYLTPDVSHQKDLTDARLEADRIGGDLFGEFLIRHLRAEGITATPAKLTKTFALFGRASHDFGFVATVLKNIYARQRPGSPAVIQRAADEGVSLTNLWRTPESNSFPSGHASIGHGMALVLSYLEPGGTKSYLEEGRKIGQHRETLAAHFPSDVEAGQRVSEWIFERMRTNSVFQKDFRDASNEVYQIERAR